MAQGETLDGLSSSKAGRRFGTGMVCLQSSVSEVSMKESARGEFQTFLTEQV